VRAWGGLDDEFDTEGLGTEVIDISDLSTTILLTPYNRPVDLRAPLTVIVVGLTLGVLKSIRARRHFQ
jgi:hypothetical protein